MRIFGKILTRLTDGLTVLTGWIAALSLAASAVIVTEGVIARKVFGVSTIWQIEASVFLLIFSVFAGAPFVQKKDGHLNVDLVIIHLPPRSREVTLIVVSIVSCALAGVIGWYAWPMWWEAFVGNDHSESLWGPPLWIPYFFLPFGMSLLCLQYILQILQRISSLKRGEVSRKSVRFELKDIDVPRGDGTDPATRKELPK